MEDHLGSTDRIKTREDIADAKDFVFKRIQDGGFGVFNACDRLVCSKLNFISDNCIKIPFVANKNEIFFDLDDHLNKGGVAFVLEGTEIFQYTKTNKTLIYDAAILPWTFKGYFKPSLVNLMCALATIYAIYDGSFPENLKEAIDSIELDPYGGRLTTLIAKNGTTIIADYAHEKESLAAVGALAKKLAQERQGKTIGVVRLAYDRTDKLITETGEIIGKSFDSLVVYDKIDGFWRKPKKLNSNSKFTQEVGKISGLLGVAIQKTNQNVTVILREDQALEFAAKIAGKNDVVVVIVNDNVRRSIDWIKEKFVV